MGPDLTQWPSMNSSTWAYANSCGLARVISTRVRRRPGWGRRATAEAPASSASHSRKLSRLRLLLALALGLRQVAGGDALLRLGRLRVRQLLRRSTRVLLAGSHFFTLFPPEGPSRLSGVRSGRHFDLRSGL